MPCKGLTDEGRPHGPLRAGRARRHTARTCEAEVHWPHESLAHRYCKKDDAWENPLAKYAATAHQPRWQRCAMHWRRVSAAARQRDSASNGRHWSKAVARYSDIRPFQPLSAELCAALGIVRMPP
jgi:hypothetical protein